MLETGQYIGEFEILGLLGKGGMGAVYKARQTTLRRLVALKLLQPALASDDSFITRFHNEAVAAAGLNHPNLVQVYAAGQTGDMHWFAMEFVDGEPLQARLERLGKIDPAEALAVVMHVANALDYGWRKARLIHRDIKPDNIFLSSDGEVKLGDLGLAKSADQENSLTMTGASMGTPLYISPEQAEAARDIDLRTDIYSLGATLFHLLCGVPVYTGNSAVSVMMKHVSAEIPDVRTIDPSLPPALAAVVLKMLQKKPQDRHASYGELSEDLQAAYASLFEAPIAHAAPEPHPSQDAVPDPPIATTAADVAEHPARSNNRGSRTMVCAMAVGAVLLAGIGYGILRPSSFRNPVSQGSPAPTPAPGSWRELFDGKSLDGWREYDPPYPSNFSVSNGEIEGKGILLFDEFFENFELELEWKVAMNNGNGGLFFLVNSGDQKKNYGGLEMQLCGSSGDPKYPTGSLWGSIRANPAIGVASGQWNSARLYVTGERCEHWINGIKVCEYRLVNSSAPPHAGDDTLQTIEIPRKSANEPASGWIGLQAQRSKGDISFRKIRLRVLPSRQAQEPRDKGALGELVRRLESKMLAVPGTKISLSKTEFTVGEWKLYLKASGTGQWTPHQAINPLHMYEETDEHPVAEITWHEAKACCDWLSAHTDKIWRLPTNDEWSAAVGKPKYPWGEMFPPDADDGNYAALSNGTEDPQKIGADGIRGTAPVASFKPNGLGFFDLGGNVKEWVGDGFQGGMRALRGADWWSGEERSLRSFCFGYHASDAKRSGVGFRLAREK